MAGLNKENLDTTNNQKVSISNDQEDEISGNNNGLEGFLYDVNQLSKDEVKSDSKSIAPENADSDQDEHVADSNSLSATDLRQKYKFTYSAWKNMKQRRRTHGAVIDQEFLEFKDFLRLVGPRTKQEYTLDRIDPNNPTYGPGLVRWVDKAVQANNKTNTINLTIKDETLPLAVWAERTNQNYQTLYKRRNAGWTDEEVITGIREGNPENIWVGTPWPEGEELNWEKAYQNQALKGNVIDGLGKGISRDDFYFEYTKRKVTKCHKDIEEYGYEMFSPEEKAPQKLLDELERWTKMHNEAKARKRYKDSREMFLRRPGGLGKNKEAALFDLLNTPPKAT